MLGLCQNVEIIHEHHHHFYELILPPKPKNRSFLHKSTHLTPHESQMPPCPSSPSNHSRIETFTSRFYHSKRSCLAKQARGIEVLSRKLDLSFQLEKINLQKAEKNQHQKPPPLMQRLPRSTATSQQGSNIMNITEREAKKTVEDDLADFCKNSETNKIIEQKINQSLDTSMQKSIPTVCRNIPHTPTCTTKRNYLHCHQLKQSKMGFPNANVYETLKKNREISYKTDNHISLSIPVDSHKPRNYYHQSSEIYIRPNNDANDSIITKKEHILTAFKTQKMFDDAKSIVSVQSLDNSCMGIDESMIAARTMDYFLPISNEKQLAHSLLYLARDHNIGWMVGIRLFQFKHEEMALREAKLYSHLEQMAHLNQTHPVLELYKSMVEGFGLEKRIYFILQPFESLLQQYLTSQKAYFRASSSSFNLFLQDIGKQLLEILRSLREKKIELVQPLELTDIVIVNGRYKLHSLSKFEQAPSSSSTAQSGMFAGVENIKSNIMKLIAFD